MTTKPHTTNESGIMHAKKIVKKLMRHCPACACYILEACIVELISHLPQDVRHKFLNEFIEHLSDPELSQALGIGAPVINIAPVNPTERTN